MLTTFDRYLFKRYLHAFVILFVCTYGLYVVIDGFSNVDAFQSGKDSTAEVLEWMATYYGYQAVQFFQVIAPVLSVLAMMTVFALLQKNGELHPVLAAGVPVYRLALPVLLGVLVVTAVAVMCQELVIPRIAHQLQSNRVEEKQDTRPVEPLYDKTRIHIGGRKLSLDENRLEQAEFMLPVPDLVFELTSLKAGEAIYLPESDRNPSGWVLKNVQPPYEQIPLTETGRKFVRRTNSPADVFVVTDVSIDQLTNRSKNYRYLSTGQLLHRIRHPSTGLISIGGQTMYFHSRMVRPLLNVLAVFLVVPLVLRRESRSLVVNMAICSLVMGTLYGSAQLFVYLGEVRLIAPDLAAWCPAILSGSLGAWLREVAQT